MRTFSGPIKPIMWTKVNHKFSHSLRNYKTKQPHLRCPTIIVLTTTIAKGMVPINIVGFLVLVPTKAIIVNHSTVKKDMLNQQHFQTNKIVLLVTTLQFINGIEDE